MNKIFFKYGHNKENIIYDYLRVDNDIIYIPAKNAESSKNIFKIIKNDNFILDPCEYLFLSEDKYLNDISFSQKKIIDDIFYKGWDNDTIEKRLSFLESDKNISDIVKKSLSKQLEILNQLNRFSHYKSNNDISYIDKFFDDFAFNLKYFSCPSFVMDVNYFGRIVEINKNILKKFKQELNLSKLEGVVIYKTMLFKKSLEEKDIILDKLINKNLQSNDINIIWVDDFSLFEKKKLLENFILLIEHSKSSNIVMHGDYSISLLLNNNICKGLNGVITNIGYGEKRKIFGSGGIPSIYYYSNIIHKRIQNGILRQYFDISKVTKDGIVFDKQIFYEKMCNCKFCKEILSISNDFNFIVSLLNTNSNNLNKVEKLKKKRLSDLFISHFVESKINEYDEIMRLNKEQLINTLKNLVASIENANDFIPGTETKFISKLIIKLENEK